MTKKLLKVGGAVGLVIAVEQHCGKGAGVAVVAPPAGVEDELAAGAARRGWRHAERDLEPRHRTAQRH